MLFRQIDLTTALRPSLLADEALLFVQDGVGLYQGKYKIPNCQQGSVYLTSLRVYYVDEADPRKNSVALDLQDVDRVEYQTRFLRTSPKILFHSKQPRHARSFEPPLIRGGAEDGSISSSPGYPSTGPRERPQIQSPVPTLNTTWVCPICSFSNPVPPKFDPATASALTPLPPCQACGIQPPLSVVLKAAIAAVSRRTTPREHDPRRAGEGIGAGKNVEGSMQADTTIPCSRCTFLNDMYLPACELCGAPLRSVHPTTSNGLNQIQQTGSPGPDIGELNINAQPELNTIKISFRLGGDKTFYERLQGAMTQRRWLLELAPPFPSPLQSHVSVGTTEGRIGAQIAITRPTSAPVGIAGLERRGLESRKNNEVVIGTAFEDLEALMASAQEIVALAESFAVEPRRESPDANSVFSESAAALGMVTTKDKLNSGSENLYLSELSRNLAEYLTDDRKGVLRAEGGIMSLIDLWAIFNRSRNGVELVSPLDFHKAAQLWEKLALPVRLRRFKSGLLVVQRSDWNDEKTISQLRAWLREPPPVAQMEAGCWDWHRFGRSVDAQETAQKFGWSVGVATEELEMAEDRAELCREEGIEGLRFWTNHLILPDEP